MKILINGFGRIGRQILRRSYDKNILIDFINDPNVNNDQARLLLQYDSVYEKFRKKVLSKKQGISIKGRLITIFREKKLSKIPFKKLGINIVIDASGVKYKTEEYHKIIKREEVTIIATRHINNADEIIVFGVNENNIKNTMKKKLISTSICDVVSLTPIFHLIQEKIPIKINSIYIVSLHPFLSYQKVLDNPSSKKNQSLAFTRSAINNLIPKNTSIAECCEDILQNLKGKIMAYQIRVPTNSVSCAFIEIVFNSKLNKEDLRTWIKYLKKPIFALNNDNLVSIDFSGSKNSSIIDKRWLFIKENRLNMMIWYDNETGYSARVIDILLKILEKW